MATKKQIELCKQLGYPHTVIPKAERHAIYKAALILYKCNNSVDDCITGICSAITNATIKINNIFDKHKSIYLNDIDYNKPLLNGNIGQQLYDICTIRYPELNKLKPKTYSIYWWDRHDYNTRVSVLEQCIELSKPKTNTCEKN